MLKTINLLLECSPPVVTAKCNSYKKKNYYKQTLKIVRIHPVLRYVIRTLVLPKRKAAEVTAQMAERVVRAYASAAADSGLIRVGSN